MTIFDEEKICDAFPFAHIEVHSQIRSTNDRAIELLRHSALKAPALIIAESQTMGRGQRNRKWWSDTGSFVRESPGDIVKVHNPNAYNFASPTMSL